MDTAIMLDRFPKIVATFTYTKAANPLKTKLNGTILAAIRPTILALRDTATLEEKIKIVQVGTSWEYYPKVCTKPGYAFTDAELAMIEQARQTVVSTIQQKLADEGATNIVIHSNAVE